ncbi:MAG: tetratricopeptide repeat protein [Promethearchaeota archaeon]|nr:MAG: tetratricopeptide repeat protein [Candidatus Lokiarchaeota archaeon]
MSSPINYPPKEILQGGPLRKKNFELIILWILNNNDICTWGDLKKKISHSTLSIYLKRLKDKGYIEKSGFNQYHITTRGKDRFYEISQAKDKKRKLSYPPEIILRRRNYDHWILWMLYNNNFCRWADFLKEPLSINQSSLSKNVNALLEKDFIRKENKDYKITKIGEIEYYNILRHYDLDRQSILEEESKRIKEITKKIMLFFEKFQIIDNNIKFHYLNNALKMPYEKIKASLEVEEDFSKILLFLSLNHPSQYPKYISREEFSREYNINPIKLEFALLRIIDENIYPIKFFKLNLKNKIYYFNESEKLGRMLNVIVEDYFTKWTYLNKLHEESPYETLSLTMEYTVNAILDEICDYLFDNGLKEALKEFLPHYINYLAYKMEKERKLSEVYDKLEGLIWQEIQTYNFDNQEIQIDSLESLDRKEAIKAVDKAIKANPKNIALYYAKSKILNDLGENYRVLTLMDQMLSDFPQEEKDIQMKRAYILKEMKNVEAGLEIIQDLLKKYPNDNDIVNYKALWLQYLNRKEESLEIIQNLIKQQPNNATYRDTYGEILMFFKEYKKAINEFQKSLELSDDNWYIYQTYIKLGVCYKELENFDLALEYLYKGKESTEKSKSDIDTKQKWIAISDLFITEIEQLEVNI